MISQYRYILTSDYTDILQPGCAYYLYAALLQLLSADYAAFLHDADYPPFSQFLFHDPASGCNVWTVSLLSREADEAFDSVLAPVMDLPLPNETVHCQLLSYDSFQSMEDFTGFAASVPNVLQLTFPVPTAFKQAGQVVALPQERLIMQSLQRKWNAAFPECPIPDIPDVRIDSFSLRSDRFPVKGNQVSGFTGEITLRCPKSQIETVQILACFARYAGVGIKTKLGMGGVL